MISMPSFVLAPVPSIVAPARRVPAGAGRSVVTCSYQDQPPRSRNASTARRLMAAGSSSTSESSSSGYVCTWCEGSGFCMCDECRGTGFRTNKSGMTKTCGQCSGSGGFSCGCCGGRGKTPSPLTCDFM